MSSNSREVTNPKNVKCLPTFEQLSSDWSGDPNDHVYEYVDFIRQYNRPTREELIENPFKQATYWEESNGGYENVVNFYLLDSQTEYTIHAVAFVEENGVYRFIRILEQNKNYENLPNLDEVINEKPTIEDFKGASTIEVHFWHNGGYRGGSSGVITYNLIQQEDGSREISSSISPPNGGPDLDKGGNGANRGKG